ncbi:DHA2 family efflux MFS transporter permease subunit [Actinoplanes sp. N902-109]|uniref:DHA2 family efflux MFS transporter permease subunit n=1 Tax=Actinoplanes sp. (strain N902-109) TaxID=649831 RepID=UPI00032962E0|nr:DHA2 family efflux MFS transporter permease subunit [Actinoplanes sp. N902-109]AGL18969.1 drug resistance transporter EmrB/QacA subfamily [Actinoplanes sp. N902-109]
MTERLDRRQLRTASVLILGAVLAQLDTTIVSVGVGSVAAGVHTSLTTVQWVTTGYLLAVALVAPLSGWLVQRFGGKRMWLLAVAIFVTGSALSGLAPTVGALIAFRVVQGLGGGLMQPIGQALVARIAGPARIGRLIGVITTPVSLAPIAGPVLGGLLVAGPGWRWMFFVNLPIGLAALVLAARLVPGDDHERERTLRLDGPGLALLPPGLVALVYGLSLAGQDGVALPRALLLAAGTLALAGYVVHALRTRRTPLLDLRLFTGRGFTLAAVNTFLIGAALYGSMLLLPLYFVQARGMSPLTAGLALAPQAVGMAVAATPAGRWTDRYGPRTVSLLGIGAIVLGTVPFLVVAAAPPLVLLVAALFVRGLGLGAVVPPNAAATYTSITRSQVPAATGARTVLNRIGGSIGTAALAIILQSGLRDTPTGAAFGHTFGWAVAFAVLTLIPAAMYPRHAPGKPAADPRPAPTGALVRGGSR